MLECSGERPWGIHETVHNDAACGRCGWVAPGPVSYAIADAEAAAREALELAAILADAGPPPVRLAA
jgi:hypothetical protein